MGGSGPSLPGLERPRELQRCPGTCGFGGPPQLERLMCRVGLPNCVGSEPGSANYYLAPQYVGGGMVCGMLVTISCQRLLHTSFHHSEIWGRKIYVRASGLALHHFRRCCCQSSGSAAWCRRGERSSRGRFGGSDGAMTDPAFCGRHSSRGHFHVHSFQGSFFSGKKG